jgi:hypothetical protein
LVIYEFSHKVTVYSKKEIKGQVPVALSYSGGRNKEDHGSKPTLGK